jgi:glycosyltransferase involved in cell wall biosynthesis
MDRRPRKRPLVSVIIATYNWSGVLRCAITSALRQTFRDFEIIAVGDGCTDDSEETVARFRDSRLRWRNLPENTGSQSAPNNTGLAMARGKYAAYLSHDDLWMPNHIERLVGAIESAGADVAYGLAVMVAPPGSPVRVLTGASESGGYEPELLVPPSSFLHRTEMAREIGGWRDHRTLHIPIDLAFLSAAWAAGKTFAPVREVTSFKFPAPWRKEVYKNRPTCEQEEYLRRMLEEPDFLARELTAVALAYAEGRPKSPVSYPPEAPGAPAGALMDQWREAKGLPRAAGSRAAAPLYASPGALRLRNSPVDIVPGLGVAALRMGGDLPLNGIFIGRGWYEVEHGETGPFRWLRREGEIVLTRLDGLPKHLAVEAESGPDLDYAPFELALRDDSGGLIGLASVSSRREVYFHIPEGEADGRCYRLIAPANGKASGKDTRVLSLRVFRLRWSEPSPTRPEHAKIPGVTSRPFRRRIPPAPARA